MILGHSLKSEIGQKHQKWVLYNVIDDSIDFWLIWDPSDPDDIRRIEKYVESNGSTVYLPNCTVKILISLWNYMDLLINQDKPEDQQDDKLYYVRDEQWTKLTAKDMRTALVNAKSKQRSSSRSLMPSFNTAPSTAPIRSPMTMELASFKKSIKREASSYSVFFEYSSQESSIKLKFSRPRYQAKNQVSSFSFQDQDIKPRIKNQAPIPKNRLKAHQLPAN